MLIIDVRRVHIKRVEIGGLGGVPSTLEIDQSHKDSCQMSKENILRFSTTAVTIGK